MPRSKKTYECLPAGKAHVIPLSKQQNFEYWFRKYYTALCFFAQSILHNEEDAKDIVQDCFIKLWDNTSITAKQDTVRSFLYTMVRNSCIDHIRKSSVAAKATLHLQQSDQETDYFDELVFAEMVRQVLEHIEALPANMRHIVDQYYLQGKKYNHIASELSTTPDAVRMQKTRAIKLLKEKLLFLCFAVFFSIVFIAY